jgi:cyclophilin family peptidyl-prolyl cis-trans isomerase
MIYIKQLDEKVNVEYEKNPHYSFKPEHIQLYKTIGGTPHLDNNYTIFGEVIEGLNVIDKIASVGKNKDDRPLIDIRMTISIISQ